MFAYLVLMLFLNVQLVQVQSFAKFVKVDIILV